MKYTEIYVITNKINGKQYVGKSRKPSSYRFNEHILRDDLAIDKAITKYGKENFTLEVIDKVPRTEENYWEKFYISEYKTHYSEGGYNITRGGDHNPMYDPKVKEKHLKVCRSDEFREKQRIINTGRKVKDTTTIRNTNLKNMEKYPHYLDGLKNYNESQKIKIKMLKDGVVVKEFDCLHDACRYFNKPTTQAGNITRYTDKYNKNGKRATFWGYQWSTEEV